MDHKVFIFSLDAFATQWQFFACRRWCHPWQMKLRHCTKEPHRNFSSFETFGMQDMKRKNAPVNLWGASSFFPDASNLSVPAGMCLVYGKFYNHIQQDGWNHWLLRQTIIPRGGAGTNLKCPFCKLKLLCAVLVRWHLVPAAAAAAATVAARWEMRIWIHAQPVSR